MIPELWTEELMNLGLQRQTDLALSALRVLASRRESISGADLADEIGTTISYLPQVMSPLVRARWVASNRGPGGGYRLTPDAQVASVRDVIEATEGSIADGRCVLRDAPCPGATECPVHRVWIEARAVLVEGLDQISALQP
jgi:Rrf2 family transcriptional regulator, iron-sulfur cluster assembly transcription factor